MANSKQYSSPPAKVILAIAGCSSVWAEFCSPRETLLVQIGEAYASVITSSVTIKCGRTQDGRYVRGKIHYRGSHFVADLETANDPDGFIRYTA